MHLLLLVCWRQYVMHSRRAGGQFPQPVPHISHFREFSGTVLHTSIISLVCSFCNYFCLFSPFFSRFCTIFRIFGPLAPRRARNPQQEHRNRGRAPARGGNADPRRPVAAAAPRGPPGPERRRRERRGEPRRPGAARPRRRATAGRPARQERAEGERVHRGGYRRPARGGTDYPEPPERAGRRRGGRRVGDSGAGGQRPGGPQADRPRKRAGPGTGAAGRIPR